MSTRPKEPEALDWLFDCSGTGYIVLDAERRVVEANDPLARMTGRARGGIIRLPAAEIFAKPEAGNFLSMLDRADGITPAPDATLPIMHRLNFEFHARKRGDEYEVAVINRSEAVRQEGELGHLKATMAISQELLRHKNQELDRSLENMARLNEQLANLDDLKSEFLSNTSHELRTPLNTIIGSLQLVREGLCENREEELEYVTTALEAGQRLLEVINDVLDSAKLTAGKMNFLIEDHRVSDLFEEVYSTVHPAAKHKGLRLVFETTHPELHMRGDFEKARQVLVNLVGNAVKFTDQGEVHVLAQPEGEAADLVRFTVRDTGIGIPAERRETIFEKFTQVDGSATRRHEGTGLGLAITRNLVELMGGTIRLHSGGIGWGTEFIFTLPAGVDAAVAAKAAKASREESAESLPLTF